jgi:branched-chain amino acid transport system permease protein
MDWNKFFLDLVNGLTLGSVYALIALGYSMVYGILKLLNFAHGEIYMIGAFTGYGILSIFGAPGTPGVAFNPGIPIALLIILMFGAAMMASGLLGVVVERVAYRPLRNAPRIAPLISALGVSFFLQNAALLLFTSNFRTYDTYDLGIHQGQVLGPLFSIGIHLGNLNIALVQIIVISTSIGLMFALTMLVGKTQIGRAMRATSVDREAAAMMGIDVDKVITFTFLVGSALAGAAGVMSGLVFQRVFHYMGFEAGLKAFTAAVVGGIGSIPGAMVGGMLIGLIESFAQGYVSTTFYLAVVFSILIVFMLVRPNGLFGARELKKV